MKKTRTGYEILQATVQEMSSDPAAFDVPLDQSKIKGILERDKDPRFVRLMVAREGVSKNKRNYSGEVIESIAEQVNANQPIGGAGHIPDEQRSHAFPATETVWLGAVVTTPPAASTRSHRVIRIGHRAIRGARAARARPVTAPQW
jgi:hypothetical protein